MDTKDLLSEVEFIPSRVPLYHSAPFYDELKACTRCTCRPEAQQVVPGVGPSDATIIFAGRNPGGDEDRQGIPFIGRGGSELNKMCQTLGIDRTKCGIINVVKCHTVGDRAPRKEEIQTCTINWLALELSFFHQAQVIFPLGHQSIQVFLGDNAESPGKKEGYWVKVRHPVNGREFHICPLNHPGYILRARGKQIQMYQSTLPNVKEYLMKELKDVYAAAI